MEVPRFAAVGLSLMLAANCFMPCYTLAYADESQEVEDGEVRMADDGQGEETSSQGQEDSQPEMDFISNRHFGSSGFLDDTSKDNDSDSEWFDSDSGADLLITDSAIPFAAARAGGSFSNATGSGGGFSSSRQIPSRSLYGANKAWIGGTMQTTPGVVDTYINWFSGDGQTKRLNAMIGELGALFQLVTDVNDWLHAIHAVNVDTKNYTVGYLPFLEDAYTLQQKQWGYGYGGTAVIQSNSPAGWLQTIRDRLQYTGDLSGSTATQSYTAGALLAYIYNNTWYTRGQTTYRGSLADGTTGQYSVAQLTAGVYSQAYKMRVFLDAFESRFLYTGDLSGSESSQTYSSAQLLAYIFNNTWWTRDQTVYSGSLADGNSGKFSVARLLAYAYNDIHFLRERSSFNGTLADGTKGDLTFSQLLAHIFGQTYKLRTYAEADSAFLSKAFSDLFDRLDSLSVDVSIDLSGVEDRLDSIVRLLTVAGVVENSKDILDAIFGDMSLDATEAASAAVGSAIQNAFPFCVPAVLKQILGLLQADPAPPEFHFDFWGAPLDFGFEDWGGLADMTGWLSRIGFAVMLFANSRRFVFAGGVGGD